jgi:hypothetical protein
VAGYQEYREQLALDLARGVSLEDLEKGLLSKATLSEEQKDALWLYGFALRDRRRLAPSLASS